MLVEYDSEPTDRQTNRQGKNNMSPTTILDCAGNTLVPSEHNTTEPCSSISDNDTDVGNADFLELTASQENCLASTIRTVQEVQTVPTVSPATSSTQLQVLRRVVNLISGDSNVSRIDSVLLEDIAATVQCLSISGAIFSGDRRGFLHTLMKALREMNVQKLYLHLGSNNVLTNDSVFYPDIADLCDLVHQVKVLPLCADDRKGRGITKGHLITMKDRMRQANSLLQDYYHSVLFKTRNMFMVDGLHLNVSGARSCLETVLEDMQQLLEVEQIEPEPIGPDYSSCKCSQQAIKKDFTSSQDSEEGGCSLQEQNRHLNQFWAGRRCPTAACTKYCIVVELAETVGVEPKASNICGTFLKKRKEVTC
ncbi:hypothetical protein DPMN_087033 [Dreissena polymorpha]|uniref:Uncharacterized protein n=1 Tax=Dreissena polymorpha TaxID=45954 RepID=A0A9D4QV43_DREPO|nr:hypothetical protein DPMN_087033 [Dreissena polymorpha]